jgi:hypothetical protein
LKDFKILTKNKKRISETVATSKSSNLSPDMLKKQLVKVAPATIQTLNANAELSSSTQIQKNRQQQFKYGTFNLK